MNAAVRDLQTLFDVGVMESLTDGQLLNRSMELREGAVFEAIVHRHGPMVWGVCRRVLRDHHDAEEAFQATLLVLARKAASVMPREKLGNWLYGVAYQTAMKARATRAKRRARESQRPDMPESGAVREDHLADLLSQLDRELSRLPDKYRVPIILCELEGKTHKEAAEQLGWPIGTLSGRLSRARAMLARRLSRPGVILSGGALAMQLAQDTASASVPTQLIGSTAQAASLFAMGRAVSAGMVSAKVAALTGEVLKIMLLSKIKTVTVALLVGFSLAAGGIGLAFRAWADEGHTRANDRDRILEKLQGTWRLIKHEPSRDNRIPDVTWRIKGKELVPIINGKELPGSHTDIVIHNDGDPVEIDLIMTHEDESKTVERGLLRSKDDNTFEACFSRRGEPRPQQFKSNDSGTPISTFKRQGEKAK
jgi:RNA polymerase sigma factor (sigma-70 family)